jgi:uncharacterized protein (DUF1501 family)
MTSTRREFLQAATAAGVLAASSGVTRLAWGASAPGTPLLVVVFLRGAADGLHLVGPSADPVYQSVRPPEMRVVDSGERAGFALERPLDPNAGFRLHAEASALAALYRGGRLAIAHAVGLTSGTRSHFVAQDLMERGIADESRIASLDTGWLTRVQRGSSDAATATMLPAYSATAAPAYALRGTPSLLSGTDVAGGVGLPWGAATARFLRAASGEGASAAAQATRGTLDLLETVDRRLPRDAAGKVLPYASAASTSYEGAGELTRSLMSVARLARSDLGLQVACVDHGGWDTHDGQAGRFATQVRQLSTGLSAFHDDMQAAGRPSVVLVMTEFGRRLRANASGGTDHGHASCWLLMGDGVQGGRMFGRWPGLNTPELDQGVDLAVTTDYRAVLAEVLRGCGWRPEAGLPGLAPAAAPLGLLRT